MAVILFRFGLLGLLLLQLSAITVAAVAVVAHTSSSVADHRVNMSLQQLASSMLSFSSLLQGLFVLVLGGILVVKLLRARKLKLPPGPIALPIVGNWLQVWY
jgi:ABC-type nickel/cobalt efflux system permease component RcnA